MAYHCATHDTQWLDDESDRCEYKRMVDAEAAIQRVRELPASQIVGSDGHVRDMLLRADVLRALDGGAE